MSEKNTSGISQEAVKEGIKGDKEVNSENLPKDGKVNKPPQPKK